MTKAQTARYWRDWGRVRKVLIELGEFSKTDADEQRKVIQREAIGCDKSSKDLTNADIDNVFKAFAAVLVMVDGPAAPEGISGPCKRLIWAIEQLGLDADTLAGIMLQQFKSEEDWRSLDEKRLAFFRMTCARAACAKRRK
jgi:hypothetical protein